MTAKELNFHLYSLIMAGGRGTRFWPESTLRTPKQYLPLARGNSLLRDTLKRFEEFIPREKRYVVTVKEQEALAKEAAVGMIAQDGLIFEPSGRNTAPCLLLGLHSLLKAGAKPEDGVILVPSDHIIHQHGAFQETLAKAAQVAFDHSKIVTIGISPSFPHTGFGYIHRGEELERGVFCVDQFVEKPDGKTARSYLSSGEYYWNAGIFVATIEVWLREFEQHAGDIYEHSQKIGRHIHNFSQLEQIYSQIPSNSIDYAIMEKSRQVAIVPAHFDWNDLGSWDALESVSEEKEGNFPVTCRDFYFQKAQGNIVYAPHKFVSLVHVNDLIVVANDSNIMVLPKEKSQEVKKIVEFIKARKDLKDLL